ncbi:fructosamine kinase family protein [Butyrivibrio sp. LC3010]|uniref:fructosamine kinase family protein n=1 Tax=Butyrivibrio sp. LC3010 TaxID=1280680 RepID=UPI000422D8EF|nr:fructosamine kinase family protein [Butyrivibrio sp. LC3010]
MEAISDTQKYGSLKEALIGIYGEDVWVKDRRAVHGGDANEAYSLYLSNGETLFIKANSVERADFFRAEAEGISAIRSTGAIRVPRIYVTGADEGYSFLNEIDGRTGNKEWMTDWEGKWRFTES